jgi:adenylate kinase
MKSLFIIPGVMTVFFLLILSCGGGEQNEMQSGAREKPAQLLQLIIIGGPGAGKGTQAAGIKEKYGVAHISTGEMLREEVAKGSELGKRVAAVMERGDLVADSIILRLIDERLKQPDCEKGFILDGFPRTLEQAEGLEPILQKRGNADVKVLLLEVSDGEMTKRLLGRERADDTEETIKNRIQKYHNETVEAIEYYEKKGNLIRIDGEQSIEDVFAEIAGALE